MKISSSTQSSNFTTNTQVVDEENSSLYQQMSENSSTSEYENTEVSNYKSRDEINDEDPALQKFKNDLITKGALKFIYDFNMEKIEEMVEKYKAKLLKEMEDNPELDLDIDKMVAAYKKDLLERLAELEDEDKKSVLNVKKMEFEIIDKINPNLEELLQKV
jgi:hypothetical protein